MWKKNTWRVGETHSKSWGEWQVRKKVRHQPFQSHSFLKTIATSTPPVLGKPWTTHSLSSTTIAHETTFRLQKKTFPYSSASHLPLQTYHNFKWRCPPGTSSPPPKTDMAIAGTSPFRKNKIYPQIQFFEIFHWSHITFSGTFNGSTTKVFGQSFIEIPSISIMSPPWWRHLQLDLDPMAVAIAIRLGDLVILQVAAGQTKMGPGWKSGMTQTDPKKMGKWRLCTGKNGRNMKIASNIYKT